MAEPLLVASVPIEVMDQEGRTATLHVSRAVLDMAEYFPVALSGRWAGPEPVRLLLPAGCTVETAQLLFLRLYMPLCASSSFDWGMLELGQVLELLQLAGMLMLAAPLDGELRRLFRASLKGPGCMAELRAHCARFEAPDWLVQLAGAQGEGCGAGNVAAALSESQIKELVGSVCGTNDPVAAKALETVLVKRSWLGAPQAESTAKLLGEMLEAFVHLQEEETVRGHKYVMREGGRAFLEAVVAFVRVCPAHLGSIARSIFCPSSREQRLESCAATQLRDTARALLGIAEGIELPALLSCILEAGRLDALEDVDKLSDVLGRADWATQVAACRVLARMPKAPVAQSSWNLLRSVLSSVVPRVCAEAQLEVCDELCKLHEDLLYQLIKEPLLQGVCLGGQLKLCGALAQLDVRRVQSVASEAVLACLQVDARRLLCAPLVPTIHLLKPEVQRIVLAELEGDGGAAPHSAPDELATGRGEAPETPRCTLLATRAATVGPLATFARPLGALGTLAGRLALSGGTPWPTPTEAVLLGATFFALLVGPLRLGPQRERR